MLYCTPMQTRKITDCRFLYMLALQSNVTQVNVGYVMFFLIKLKCVSHRFNHLKVNVYFRYVVLCLACRGLCILMFIAEELSYKCEKGPANSAYINRIFSAKSPASHVGLLC